MTAISVHATAIAINYHGVLLVGPSGSGKSDLALRLIDRGAVLVSDDIVYVEQSEGKPLLRAAPNIEGRIELRGVGIIEVLHTKYAAMRMVAEMAPSYERIPPENLSTDIAGYSVPLVKIAALEASAPLKVEYALRSIVDADIWPMPLSHIRPNESPAT
ncbi:HPr kinase/phosphorylase [Sphingorhabdus sp.]|uniref:HPr kinase/phosphorylase n=1 Tax=Sphingorhabdus sp. TaxID=1902408 RepID=UPI00359335DB